MPLAPDFAVVLAYSLPAGQQPGPKVTTMNTFDLTAPARETLATLWAAKDLDAWQGALIIFAGIELDAAAALVEAKAAEFAPHTVHDSCLDLVGLETRCERTAAWLVKWLDRNVDCLDGDGNKMQAYVAVQRTNSRGQSWVAVYRQHKISP